jgi:hypothetical protein
MSDAKLEPQNLPWRNSGGDYIYDANNQRVADCRYKSNQCEAIVAAVNSYPQRDAMRAALEALVQEIDRSVTRTARISHKDLQKAKDALKGKAGSRRIGSQMTSEDNVKNVYLNARIAPHGVFRDMVIVVIPPPNIEVEPHWGKILTTKCHADDKSAWDDAWQNIQAAHKNGGK